MLFPAERMRQYPNSVKKGLNPFLEVTNRCLLDEFRKENISDVMILMTLERNAGLTQENRLDLYGFCYICSGSSQVMVEHDYELRV